jgi:hypothetical protein
MLLRAGLFGLTALIAFAACSPRAAKTEAPEATQQAEAAFVAPDYAKLAGYPEGWYVSAGWPGEYPAGIAVLDAGVNVMGRAKPNPSAPSDKACALPQFANYQLWNNPRVAADQLEFFVATRTFPITINADTELEYVTDAGPQKLAVKTGDQLTYLRYLGEGFTVLSYQGREFDMHIGELSAVSDVDAQSAEDDLWVRVKCGEGHQAWLLYDDVITAPGIGPSPLSSYGEATDLTPQDVEEVRTALSTQEQMIEPAGAPPEQ